MAAHFHPIFGERVRVEHWLNAIEQGAAAARSMLGKGAPYAELHWFWSDQYDANLQYAGHHRSWDELVVRGCLEERRFVAFYVNGGVPTLRSPSTWAVTCVARCGLLRARQPVAAALLRDPEVDLRTLGSG